MDTSFTGALTMRNIFPHHRAAFVSGLLLTASFLSSCNSGASTEADVDLSGLPPLPEIAAEAAAPAGPPRPGEPLSLRIALVGEVRGELEPCGCPTLPYGGFVRRQRLLDELRADGGGPLFHLDAGETLLKGFSSDRADRDERAEAVLDLSAEVGVDAWAPGPSDLIVIGIDGIQRAGLRATSASWRGPNGERLLPPAVVVERDGARLGVIGLSAAPTEPTLQAVIQTDDPVDAARDALALWRGRSST